MKIRVFSSQLRTPENPSGAGWVDLETPEGIKIVGGGEATTRIKGENKIAKKMRELAIQALKAKGELPPDYQAIGGK